MNKCSTLSLKNFQVALGYKISSLAFLTDHQETFAKE
jgi:hypothetical protein